MDPRWSDTPQGGGDQWSDAIFLGILPPFVNVVFLEISV